MADDGLAYGDYHNQSGQEGERNLLSDTFNQLRSRQGNASGLLGKLSGAVQNIGNELAGRLQDVKIGTQAAAGGKHRFGSFAQPREGNQVKWYVDGCSYFWAVSEALIHAHETIWILDWWLSPELYLRRPPAKNEQYRLDRMLKAAAERGVSINIIVYKEVEKALTCSSVHTKHALEALHPNIKVFRHPDHAPDPSAFMSSFKSSFLSAQTLAKLPEDTLKAVYGMNEDVILYWAHHEKLCLIDGQTAFMGGLDLCYGRWDLNQHPISDVHPTDLQSILFPGQDYNNARIMDFQDVAQPELNKLNRTRCSRMGWSDVSIGLRGPAVADLEAHFVQRWNFIYYKKYIARKEARYQPLYLEGSIMTTAPVTTGQSNVSPQNQQNTQGYTYDSQAGPSKTNQASFPPPPHAANLGNSAQENVPPPPPGPPPQDGNVYFPPPPPGAPPKDSETYFPPPPPGGPPPHETSEQAPYFPPPPLGAPSSHETAAQDSSYYPPPPPGGPAPHQNFASTGPTFQPPSNAVAELEGSREADQDSERGLFPHGSSSSRIHSGRLQDLENQGRGFAGKLESRVKHAYHDYSKAYAGRRKEQPGAIACQLTRSCTEWSNGTPLEHSIQNAYIEAIKSSQHFIYIENQFFITATGSKQGPVKNQIGAALVERILRAAQTGQKFKVIVLIPSVPAFAGNLRDESSLGTRAIMEFQYNSINRGGYSIMEEIDKAGYNPMEYIRFYNLRSYDRINTSKKLRNLEQSLGISYESVRREADKLMDPIGQRAQDGSGKNMQPASRDAYDTFQREASKNGQTSGRWDSVSECYMLGGADIRNVPWDGDAEDELDAFVSEELYIHSKVMIIDDRIVICGSANLNDRSQLGSHDSEIALVIEDHDPLPSYMDGRPWKAGRFAATLRRQLFRKHLGLIPAQQPAMATTASTTTTTTTPDARNMLPVGVPNEYDYGSAEDHLVQDPLADPLLNFWNSRARRNTDAFRKVFRPVPDDNVLTWGDYDSFYGVFSDHHDKEKLKESKVEDGSKNDAARDDADKKGADGQQPKYRWGHVVVEDFLARAGGSGAAAAGDTAATVAATAAVAEVKECLSTIRGTLVEMPLRFLIKEDIARQGLTLNAATEPIYT